MIELGALVLTLGAVLYRSFNFDLFTIGLVAFSLVAFLYFIYRSGKGTIFSFLMGGALMLGALAVWNAERPMPEGVFGSRAFESKVVSVDRRLTKTNLVVKETESNARLQVAVEGKSKALPGDIISVRATIEKPEAFLTDSGRIFDYPRYLESKGIVGIGQHAQVIVLEKGPWSLPRIAAVARFRIADIFAGNAVFPVDGIMAGMAVGYQGGLPTPIQDLFRNTGVLHVLVLSGYNITLLAGFLGLALRNAPFRLRTMLIIVAIIMLVVISGSGIASIRAGIMGSIALVAGLAIRTYQPLRALTLAYLFFFFLSPETIFSDPGFHLSFLATAFMVLMLPKIEQFFSFIPKTKGIDVRELLMLAFTIPIFMLPYTMYFSGDFPLAAPVANILLAILTPLLMALGIVLVAVFWIVPVAHLLGLLASSIGMVVINTLEFFARLPTWNTPALPWWGVSIFYFILFYVLFKQEISSYARQLQNFLAPASNSSDS